MRCADMARQVDDLRGQCRYRDTLVIEGFHTRRGSCWLADDWPVGRGVKRACLVEEESGCSAGWSLSGLGEGRGWVEDDEAWKCERCALGRAILGALEGHQPRPADLHLSPEPSASEAIGRREMAAVARDLLTRETRLFIVIPLIVVIESRVLLASRSAVVLISDQPLCSSVQAISKPRSAVPTRTLFRSLTFRGWGGLLVQASTTRSLPLKILCLGLRRLHPWRASSGVPAIAMWSVVPPPRIQTTRDRGCCTIALESRVE